MKVKELIALLEKEDPEADVYHGIDNDDSFEDDVAFPVTGFKRNQIVGEASTILLN